MINIIEFSLLLKSKDLHKEKSHRCISRKIIILRGAKACITNVGLDYKREDKKNE
jgi:hypothetical protein